MNIRKSTLSIILLMASLLFSLPENAAAQELNDDIKLKNNNSTFQQPTKKVYFVPGGKFGMFFLQGDFNEHQMIALEGFGQYRASEFIAEISVPFRFKTSPAFSDIGVDINIYYPFLGKKNKSEFEPFVGGGLGLHFIGYDKGIQNGESEVAARGGMGLNLIAGVIFMKNYDFNIVTELKYFNYLRELDNLHYHGIGLNIGVMLHTR
jgi:hypothetical protein